MVLGEGPTASIYIEQERSLNFFVVILPGIVAVVVNGLNDHDPKPQFEAKCLLATLADAIATFSFFYSSLNPCSSQKVHMKIVALRIVESAVTNY